MWVSISKFWSNGYIFMKIRKYFIQKTSFFLYCCPVSSFPSRFYRFFPPSSSLYFLSFFTVVPFLLSPLVFIASFHRLLHCIFFLSLLLSRFFFPLSFLPLPFSVFFIVFSFFLYCCPVSSFPSRFYRFLPPYFSLYFLPFFLLLSCSRPLLPTHSPNLNSSSSTSVASLHSPHGLKVHQY